MAPILFVSGRDDGHCGLAHPENRKKFFKKVGLTEKEVVSMHLTHSNNVAVVTKKDGGKLLENTDGLITNVPGLFLALPVGDCAPIMVYDPLNEVVGVVHAGWRGLVSEILKKTITKMVENFGTDRKEITVYIGAYICQKHYEVKEDVVSVLEKYKKSVKTSGGKTFLDLGKCVSMQLIEAGVNPGNIKIDEKCTYEDPDLFSHRRGDSGRNLYLFGLTS